MATDTELVNSSDARVWADEFFKNNPTCTIPKDVMVGWFANAIMAGHDFAKRAPKQEKPDYESEYFRHFKGGLYKFIGEVRDSETLEDKILYENATNGLNYIRTKVAFFEEVNQDGYKGPRFKKTNVKQCTECFTVFELKSGTSLQLVGVAGMVIVCPECGNEEVI